jgi:hypothetical protein
MKRLLLLIVLSLIVFSCKNDTVEQQELSVEATELKLKEKELLKKEAKIDTHIPPIVTKNTATQSDRKLRFLYYSPVGLRAYFDDGSIIACPRCELTQENIELIQSNSNDKAIQKYVIEDDGSLTIDGWKHEFPSINKEEDFEGWAMINYKWFVTY